MVLHSTAGNTDITKYENSLKQKGGTLSSNRGSGVLLLREALVCELMANPTSGHYLCTISIASCTESTTSTEQAISLYSCFNEAAGVSRLASKEYNLGPA